MTYATDAFQVSSTERHEYPRNLSDVKAVEICFEEHEIFAGDRAIAKIILTDEDFETQPWAVIINGIEIHRANTWAKCFHYITWHFTQGTLPEQETVTARKENVALPIFIPQQKSKQLNNFVEGIYTQLIEFIKIARNYFSLLFEMRKKSCDRGNLRA